MATAQASLFTLGEVEERDDITVQQYLGATAINITQLDAYFAHELLDHTHNSRLMRLQAATMN